MQGGEQATFEINLLGPFCILGPDGQDRTPKSKRACALLALLALSPRKTRTRVWLRDKLWSERGETQAAASLRQCIHQARTALGDYADHLFGADKDKVWLNADRFSIDIQRDDLDFQSQEQLLEGMDIRDPEFEEWLTLERQIWLQKCSAGQSVQQTSSRLGFATAGSDQDMREASDAPTIAIIPFDIHGGGIRSYEAQGLADDLIIALSKNRWLKVISRHSTFSAEHENRTSPLQARDFGADYLLSGTLVGDGAEPAGQLQIKLRLESDRAGTVIWSDQIQIPADELHDAKRQITERLLIKLLHELGRQEQLRATTSRLETLETWQHVHLGNWHMMRYDSENIELAYECYHHALDLDPEQTDALFALSWWHVWRSWLLIGAKGQKQHLLKAEEYARQGLRIDPSDARGYAYIAAVAVMSARAKEAVSFADEALAQNPSMAQAHTFRGSALILLGRCNEAIETLQTSYRLNPTDPYRFHMLGELAAAYYFEGLYEEALKHAQFALVHSPGYWYPNLIALCAVQKSGLPHESAHLFLKALLKQMPADVLHDHIERIPYTIQSMNQDLLFSFGEVSLG